MFTFIADLLKNRLNKPSFSRTDLNNAKALNQSTFPAYDPFLIDSLEQDHLDLMVLYKAMWSDGYYRQDFEGLAATIEQFKADFQSHILKENVKLFTYLEQTLAENPLLLKLVREFRHDINNVASTIIPFCKKYGITPFSLSMENEFEHDYAKVGELLSKRLESEEQEIYPLYQPY